MATQPVRKPPQSIADCAAFFENAAARLREDEARELGRRRPSVATRTLKLYFVAALVLITGLFLIATSSPIDMVIGAMLTSVAIGYGIGRATK